MPVVQFQPLMIYEVFEIPLVFMRLFIVIYGCGCTTLDGQCGQTSETRIAGILRPYFDEKKIYNSTINIFHLTTILKIFYNPLSIILLISIAASDSLRAKYSSITRPKSLMMISCRVLEAVTSRSSSMLRGSTLSRWFNGSRDWQAARLSSDKYNANKK